MKKIIKKKVYDTEKTELIAEYSNGLSQRDFKHVYEDLYRTEKGQFFLHAQGGPLTKYSVKEGNLTHGIETIILLTPEEAYEWLEKRNKHEGIKKYFHNQITMG